MRPVKIAWYRLANLPLRCDLKQAVSPEELKALLAKVRGHVHKSYCLKPGVLLEMPPKNWGHGDYLVYLPERGWLVRRNYTDRWYVDIGVLREVERDHYAWTDLWLDLTCGEGGKGYKVLDENEFEAAVRDKRISDELASYAWASLDSLIEMVNSGLFPPAEVLEAERVADSLKKGS